MHAKCLVEAMWKQCVERTKKGFGRVYVLALSLPKSDPEKVNLWLNYSNGQNGSNNNNDTLQLDYCEGLGEHSC